tara:strand:+ start:13661 stop:14572 length:912 start_codon:yes stop_codon:yes gene_type:complete
MEKILVIKLGALGDFVQATGAFSAIRQHHADAEITLLTTKGMMPFAKDNPNFDKIHIDTRQKLYNLSYLKRLMGMLRGYDMVYDLQTNDRTNFAYYFLAGRPAWCGIAPCCTYKQVNPLRGQMHTLDRLADQLKVAGVENMDAPNLLYAAKDSAEIVREYGLDLSKLILLVPGGSAHRPEKRWSYFAELSDALMAKGYQTVLVGAGAEESLLNEIEKKCAAINLCNKTSIGELIDLSSKAAFVIGNDTGPTHIAVASGAKGAVLFGSASNPKRCAPRGEGVHIFHKTDIDAITTQEIVGKVLG